MRLANALRGWARRSAAAPLAKADFLPIRPADAFGWRVKNASAQTIKNFVVHREPSFFRNAAVHRAPAFAAHLKPALRKMFFIHVQVGIFLADLLEAFSAAVRRFRFGISSPLQKLLRVQHFLT